MISGLTMSRERLLRAYSKEARFECIRMMRSPTFTLLALLMPLLMYLFLGVYLDGILSKASPERVAATFGHWCVFSVMWPGMFGFGASVAIERDQGLIALKRAMPVPLSAYLFGKCLMSVIFAFVASALISVACACSIKSGLTASQYLVAIAVSTVGALLFSAVGLFIGSRSSAQHVTGMMYLAYIPLMLLAGLFFPVPHNIKLTSPAFYLDQVLSAALTGNASGSPFLYALAVVGLTVLLTVLSARHLSRRVVPG